MATEEVPVTKETLEEKLGDLKIEEPEKFEDTTETPVPEDTKEALLDELKESPPELQHVETKDTTETGAEPTKEGVVKAVVPAAFEEELKSDHDIVPPAEGVPTSTVETTVKQTGPEGGETAPTTKEVPVEVTHEDVDKKSPSKISSIGEKITATLHKITGKE